MSNVPSDRVLLLDTSLQVDRIKTGERKTFLENLFAEFTFTMATGISLLEFKAVVIQECITIHNSLRRTNARFTVVRDQLLESMHRQAKLRTHIFNNLISVFGSSHVIDEIADRKLAEKARLALEMQIPELYSWFRKSVDSVLDDKIQCNRATEPPEKKSAAFTTNLPICRKGINKTCHVEPFVRLHAGDARGLIARESDLSEQMVRTTEAFAELLENQKREWSHQDCRRVGDCLIALEAKQRATHAASTNRKDWEVVSKVGGFEFVSIDYPRRS